MLLFGHLGIGSKIASPWSEGLSRRWLLFGTVLPDLVDKTLYYGLVLLEGKHGTQLGLISGTRTFGHSALLLILLTLVAMWRESRVLAALSLGIATHILLDNLLEVDPSQWGKPLPATSTLYATLFPTLGLRFPVSPHDSAAAHFLSSLTQPKLIVSEIVGIGILAWDEWKIKHRPEILGGRKKRKRSRGPGGFGRP